MSRAYAIVGLGHRAHTFLQSLLGPHATDGPLVALCDANPGRLAHAAAIAADAGVRVPTYAADGFDQAGDVDRLRDRHRAGSCTLPLQVVRALELGADVITEKPLTADVESCRRIVAAQHRHRGYHACHDRIRERRDRQLPADRL